MLIKIKDDVGPMVNELNRLLKTPDLSRKQREWIEDEIDNVRSGAKGEKDAAYHLDFAYQNSNYIAVIHDLRIEHEGRVAQIDHLLINRMMDIFVIESKNISTGIKVSSDGEFEVRTRYGWKGMASPVEQNKRHIQVLSSLIQDCEMTPKFLGFHIKPVFHQWVLVPPECNISQKSQDMNIVKMDMFVKKREEWINSMSAVEILSAVKMVSSKTLNEFAQALISHDRPIQFDFAARFGINDPPASIESRYAPPPIPTSALPRPSVGPVCESCRAAIDEKIVAYCRFNKKKFSGKILCRQCQATVSAVTPACELCSMPVDDKVVAFCRFNSKKFGKKIYCRSCQTLVV